MGEGLRSAKLISSNLRTRDATSSVIADRDSPQSLQKAPAGANIPSARFTAGGAWTRPKGGPSKKKLIRLANAAKRLAPQKS
jgi:hypothetical protein